MSVVLKNLVDKLIRKNLTEKELSVAESICADFVKSNPTHEWCYRVWVKSFCEGENADKVEVRFEMYERVFTEKSDADEYESKVKADLSENGFYPFESAYKFYDCAVMQSTIVLNWNNVRLW